MPTEALDLCICSAVAILQLYSQFGAVLDITVKRRGVSAFPFVP